MFVKDRLAGGDRISPIPLGLQLALEYNDKGALRKVYSNYDKTQDISKDILQGLITNSTVPQVITVKNGTTWIYGVLYTQNVVNSKSTGLLPHAVVDDYIVAYRDTPENFQFLAGYAESLAVNFTDPNSTQNWLNMSGFQCLPNYLMPGDITESKFEQIVSKSEFTFTYSGPLITDIVVFRQNKYHTVSTNLIQQQIIGINKFIDVENGGNIFAGVVYAADLSYFVPYSTSVEYDLKKGDMIIYDGDDAQSILYNYRLGSTIVDVRNIKDSCPTCGKLLSLETDTVRCSDVHCPSVQYPALCQFLKTLNLPTIHVDTYAEIVKDRIAFSVLDIFDSVEYNSVTCDVTISTALRSIIPNYILPNAKSIESLVDRCNSSVPTVEYYIQNPDKMLSELHLDKNIYTKFSNWFQSDKQHIDDVVAVLHNPHISIISNTRQYAAKQLLDGKDVYTTGKFEHSDIQHILCYYGATIVDDYVGADIVVIGDVLEDINGAAVNFAKTHNREILTEIALFHQYDVAADIS